MKQAMLGAALALLFTHAHACATARADRDPMQGVVDELRQIRRNLEKCR